MTTLPRPASASRDAPFVAALRDHFALDPPAEPWEAPLASAAMDALRALAIDLTEHDRRTVIDALTRDPVDTDRPHRLVWRGMSRRYAPVEAQEGVGGKAGGWKDRFITPDLDTRLATVVRIVGGALGPLAALERERCVRFGATPVVTESTPLTDARTGRPSLVIESDNLAALRYLAPTITGGVDLIYADPPYNSGERLFRYQDRFTPEAWLTMMRDRLEMLIPLLAPTGAAAFSINESYAAELKLLCDDAFGRANFLTALTVRVRHEDRIIKGARAYQDVTEQVLLYRASPAFTPPRRSSPRRDDEYEWAITLHAPPARTQPIAGRAVEFYAPGSFALTRGHAPDGLKRINIRGALREANSSGRFFVAYLEPLFAEHRGWLIRVPGIGADGLGRRDFLIPPDGPRRNADYLQGRPLDATPTRELPYPNLADFEGRFNKVAAEDGARFRNGKKPVALLRHIMTLTGIDAKPDALVLDPFAGSGSSAAAVLALNKHDGGARRFVAIDRAEHLRSVTVPRLQRLLADPAHADHAATLLALNSPEASPS